MAVEPAIIPQCVLQSVSAVMWLKSVATALLGLRMVMAIEGMLIGLRDTIVRQQGLHPVVLSLPDGLHLPPPPPPPRGASVTVKGHRAGSMPAATQGAAQPGRVGVMRALDQGFGWLGAVAGHHESGGEGGSGSGSGARPPQRRRPAAGSKADATAGGGSGGTVNGFASTASGSSGDAGIASWALPRVLRPWRWVQRQWQAAGGDKVDPDSMVITALLGALAGVLWVQRQRRQPGGLAGLGAERGLRQRDARQQGGLAAAAQGAAAAEPARQQLEQGQEQEQPLGDAGNVGVGEGDGAAGGPEGGRGELRQRRVQ